MIKIVSGSAFTKTGRFLDRVSKLNPTSRFDSYGKRGVEALASATSVDTGLTASSWTYDITRSRGKVTIVWRNTNTVDGTPVAILLQYGHGTGTGGWVNGVDYINPAIQPIFDQIARDVWEEVTRNA